MRLRNIVILILIAFAGISYKHTTSPVGNLAASNIDPTAIPVQIDVSADETIFFNTQLESYKITPKAKYYIAARVLHTKKYSKGWESDLSPLDLALGWGDLSDPKVDEWISWRQSGRWYYWRWSKGSPYRNKEIIRQSANVHIIPANKNIKYAMLKIGHNDIIGLEGYLVNVSKGKKYWNTSTTRNDTGDGSCEILYVEKVIINDKLFE